jgi:hypothetical protein
MDFGRIEVGVVGDGDRVKARDLSDFAAAIARSAVEYGRRQVQ